LSCGQLSHQKRKLGLAPHFLLSLPGGRALALGVGDTIVARLAGKYQDTSDASSLEKVRLGFPYLLGLRK
jgi:hypothetical protein